MFSQGNGARSPCPAAHERNGRYTELYGRYFELEGWYSELSLTESACTYTQREGDTLFTIT
jgi:hypothetical protein